MQSSPYCGVESFSKWQMSYNHLADAVNSFRDACNNLLQTVPRSHTSYVEKIWLEGKLSQLRKEADGLELIQGILTCSQAVMRRATNTSAALVPINVLPLEILSRIFKFSASPSTCANRCGRISRQHSLVVIPSVCVQWREIALSTHSLWSNISVNEDVSRKKSNTNAHQWTKLLLHRSGSAPLSLHFHEDSAVPRPDVDRITTFLQPHIRNVKSFVFDGSSSQFVQAILTLYSSHLPLTPLVTLAIVRIRAEPAGPKFTWPVNSLRGLCTLILSELPILLYPHMDEFAQILLYNPHLRYLRIRQKFPVLYSDSLPRVHVPHLRDLELDIENNVGLGQQLSILEPGANGLNVTLSLSHSLDLKCSQEIEAFFGRANVTRLNICSISADHTAQLFNCLGSVPFLQILSLSCMGENGSASLGALLVTSNDGEALARFPSLQCLMISEMSIDQAQLKRIVDIYQLRSVTLGYEVAFQAGPKGSMNGKDFLNWLRQRVKIAISVEIEEEEETDEEENS
ncbi:hypothetical protein FRC12_000729 [Ceratobasidium sp. 428]|nr:hypothetical protein FRC12_000729 [Ceratobasidium sp. 428]